MEEYEECAEKANLVSEKIAKYTISREALFRGSKEVTNTYFELIKNLTGNETVSKLYTDYDRMKVLELKKIINESLQNLKPIKNNIDNFFKYSKEERESLNYPWSFRDLKNKMEKIDNKFWMYENGEKGSLFEAVEAYEKCLEGILIKKDKPGPEFG